MVDKMKILYVFDTKDHEVFKMSDLPDRFEIIREGKKPIVFKLAATRMQDMYSRLDRAERLLKEIVDWNVQDDSLINSNVRRSVDKYFDRQS